MDEGKAADRMKPGSRSASPDFFKGMKKTFFRYNLITGTIASFAVMGAIAMIPVFFTSIVVRN